MALRIVNISSLMKGFVVQQGLGEPLVNGRNAAAQITDEGQASSQGTKGKE